MTKTYTNAIICGGALETLRDLPDASVDLGVTSPPYNKHEKNNGGLVKKVVYSTYKDTMSEADYQANQAAVLDEIFRITKAGGSFFYNHKLRYINGAAIHPMDWLRKTKWVIKQEIIWDRTIAGNIRGWRFWQVEERVYWLYKPLNANPKGAELESKHAKLTSIWRGVPESKNPHPAPFPLWLPARIIASVLKSKGVVLDPYVGSGTTAVAAKLLGHDYIGIDVDADYCSYAVSRIAESASERAALNRELDLHVVEKAYWQRKAEAKSDALTPSLPYLQLSDL